MKIAFAPLALAVIASPAHAVIFQGSYAVTVNNPGQPGLEILTEELADPFNFALSKNQSTTFDLFRIWTSETSVNSRPPNNDDVIARPITVDFTFTQPAGPGSVSGQTVGVNLFVTHFGLLSWTNPVQTFTFGSTKLEVRMENNVAFNAGLFGLLPGKEHGQNVEATFTLTAIPEPASWAMMIGGFGLAGAAVRRRARLNSVLPA